MDESDKVLAKCHLRGLDISSRMKSLRFYLLGRHVDLHRRHTFGVSNMYERGCALFSLSTGPSVSRFASSTASRHGLMMHSFRAVDIALRRNSELIRSYWMDIEVVGSREEEMESTP